MSRRKTTSDPANVYNDEEKVGGTCCCCDFRRAVVICNMILIIFSVIGVIAAVSGYAPVARHEDENIYVTVFGVLAGLGILFSLIAIAGAATFNKFMVGVNVAWLFISLVAGIVNQVKACDAFEEDSGCQTIIWLPIIIGVVITLAWSYPHVMFIVEIKDGKFNNGNLTPETVNREEAADRDETDNQDEFSTISV